MNETTNVLCLTPKETAYVLHVSTKTITRWRKEGKLPYVRTPGGHHRYPEPAIMEIARGMEFEVGDVREDAGA